MRRDCTLCLTGMNKEDSGSGNDGLKNASMWALLKHSECQASASRSLHEQRSPAERVPQVTHRAAGALTVTHCAAGAPQVTHRAARASQVTHRAAGAPRLPAQVWSYACIHAVGLEGCVLSAALPPGLLTKNKMDFEHEIPYGLIFSERAGTLPTEG